MPTRILIVEDNAPTRRALRLLLHARGYQVHEAETVQGGIAGIENADIIILDLMLPDGNGVVILRLIRALKLPIRVIVTSGMHRDDYPNVEGAEILPKPYDVERLMDLLASSTRESQGALL